MSRIRISSGEGYEQDFELNLASIIDCFVVVIAYLLLSASFIAIGAFDVGIAAQGAGSDAQPPKPPEVTVSVLLQESHNTVVRVSGKENRSYQVEPKGDAWDYEGITAQLEQVKEKWRSLASVNVATEGSVEYQALVKGIESARKSVPTVFIGEEAN
jgi:biopolymer transport protein ExbD